MKSRRGSLGSFGRPAVGRSASRQFEALEERWLFSASPAEHDVSPSEPELATIAEVTTPWDAPIAAGSTQLIQLPAVEVRFTEPLDAASVENLLHWQVLSDGVDISARIQDVMYTGDTALVTFGMPLRGESITLTALDGIVDALGRPIDGDSNGAVGGNWELEFGIQQGAIGVSPPVKLFDVAKPDSLRNLQLAFSENGGFALAMTEGQAGSLLYEGAVSNPEVDTYPRSYLQIFDDSLERLGPLQRTSIWDLQPVIALGGDEYLISGRSSIPNSYYTYTWYMKPESSTFIVQPSTPAPVSLAGDVYRLWTEEVRSGENYGSRLTASQFRASFSQAQLSAVEISSLRHGNQKDATFDQNAAGDFVVVWASRSQWFGPFSIYARRFDVNGNPRTPEIRVDSSTTDQARPSVAVASDGSFVVTWTALTGTTDNRALMRRFAANGTPLGEARELVATTVPFTAAPRIRMDDHNRAIVHWATDQQISILSTTADLVNFDEVQTWNLAPDRKLQSLFSAEDAQGDFVLGWLDAPHSDTGSLGGISVQRFSFGHGAAVDLNGNADGTDSVNVTRLDGSPALLADPGSILIRKEITGTLQSATLRFDNPLPGDLLSADTAGTNLSAHYASGVLTISGADRVENYERVLRRVTFSSTADREAASIVEIGVSVNDGYYEGLESFARLQVYRPGSNRVVNRYITYKGMYDERYSSLPSENADIPPNKEAYLPGSGPATFANITGFDRGINRIVVETYGLRGGITADDFSFRVGTSLNPDEWAAAPAPSKVKIGRSSKNPDRDRITIEWPDGAIKNTWLEVTLAANVRTGLATPDVFYYGNKVGDTGEGNSAVLATTSAADVLAIRRMRNVYPYVTNPYDLNRDRKIDATDEALVRANLGVLRMLNLPATGALAISQPGALPLAASEERLDAQAVASALAMPRPSDGGAPASGGATTLLGSDATRDHVPALQHVAVAVALAEETDSSDDEDSPFVINLAHTFSDEALLDALLGE